MPEYMFSDTTIQGRFRGGDLAFLPEGKIALFDQEGQIIEYDLAEKCEIDRDFVGSLAGVSLGAAIPVSGYLWSPSIPSQLPEMMAVATRGGHFVIRDLRDKSFHRLQPRESGPVNCVAFSHIGDSLLIGVGDYPLSSRFSGAYLELYRVKEGKLEFVNTSKLPGFGHVYMESCSNLAFVNSTVLPGVCVDCLAWLNDNEAFCVTGARSQDHGFLIRFTPDPFRILAIRETTSAWARRLFVRYDSVVVQFPHEIVEFPFSTKEKSAEAELDVYKFEAPSRLYESVTDLGLTDYDRPSDSLLLTDGTLLDIGTGEREQLLEPLPECFAIRGELPFRAVALSEHGVLRCYQKAMQPGASSDHARES